MSHSRIRIPLTTSAFILLAVSASCSRPDENDAAGADADLEAAADAGPDLDAAPPADAATGSLQLAGLTVSPGNLTPDFDPAVTVYSCSTSLSAQEVVIRATLVDPGATLSVAGQISPSGSEIALPLALGENSIEIVVQDDQGQQTTTLTVIRGDSVDAFIKASNSEEGDEFGGAVVVSGDTLAVSSMRESSDATGVDGPQNNNAALRSGAVYVFRRQGDDWMQEAYLKASNTGAYDNFGRSLALSGDLLVVGAEGEDSDATGASGDPSNNQAD
jgi:hypothetical protein